MRTICVFYTKTVDGEELDATTQNIIPNEPLTVPKFQNLQQRAHNGEDKI